MSHYSVPQYQQLSKSLPEVAAIVAESVHGFNLSYEDYDNALNTATAVCNVVLTMERFALLSFFSTIFV